MTVQPAERAVVVVPDAATLAETAGARLLRAILDARSSSDVVHVVVTGGTIGVAALAAARRNPTARTVDWSAVHVWWGDERYLPVGHSDRNETQARRALLDHVPIPPGNVHPMPAAGVAASAEDSARAYAARLAEFAAPGAAMPEFTVLMLGVGPDGHVASLFPGLPGPAVEDAAVIAVHDSPKPPLTRVSLTFAAIGAAREVWLIASGAAKAGRVAAALAGADPRTVPAAGARGRLRTVWLLDADAAAGAAPQGDPPGAGPAASSPGGLR